MSDSTPGCPHCAQPLFRRSESGNKLRARTRIIVLHKAGELEINCGSCGGAVVIGELRELRLRKAMPRLVLSVRAPDIR